MPLKNPEQTLGISHPANGEPSATVTAKMSSFVSLCRISRMTYRPFFPPIVVPNVFPYITPLNKGRLQLIKLMGTGSCYGIIK